MKKQTPGGASSLFPIAYIHDEDGSSSTYMTDSPTVLAATNIMEVASLVSSDSSGGFVSRGLVGWLWSDTEGRKGCFQILLSPPGDAGDTTFFSPLPVLFSSISCMWILLGVILMGTG